MIDTLRWLVALEVIGVAFLPLSLWLFRWLPDRGYGFAKLFGLLATTYVVWLIASVIPIAGTAIPLLVVLALAAGLGWWYWGNRSVATLRAIPRLLILEEALFLLVFIVWTVMRATVFHPGIGHTEQYMDLTLLQSTMHSASFPPYDAWMSGHTVNYYYLGYLLYANVLQLCGVAPAVGYNLAISTVFAFTVAGAYSVGLALSRRPGAALLAPLFVAVLGNWHAILVQIPQGHPPGVFFWFWDSTRIVGGNDTINEFPFFSFMLGDLHGHVMALPVTIMVIGLATTLAMAPRTLRLGRDVTVYVRLAIAAAVAGSLYAINSWDLPAFVLVLVAGLTINAYATDSTTAWWRAPLVTIPAVAASSVVLFLPYYAHYRSPAHGIGLVSTPADPFQFLQIFGLFILAVALLLVTYGLVFQPENEEAPISTDVAESGRSALEAGAVRGLDTYLYLGALAAAGLIIGVRFHLWTLVLVLGLAYAALTMVLRVLNTERPRRADAVALALILVGLAMLAATEVVYLRDEFDGGSNYRMNTVFKFYYEGWTLLGLAAAYAVYRTWTLLRKHFSPAAGWLALSIVIVGVGMSGLYTLVAPQSANLGGAAVSLDGLSQLAADHPTDAAGIRWLIAHGSSTAVELEATGGDYKPEFARVSTFTGMPTVLGWGGHELQWRGPDPEIGHRTNDINTIYGSTNIAQARALLRRYGVRYVFVGDTERACTVQVHSCFSPAALAKFGRFMQVVFRDGSTVIYQRRGRAA